MILLFRPHYALSLAELHTLPSMGTLGDYLGHTPISEEMGKHCKHSELGAARTCACRHLRRATYCRLTTTPRASRTCANTASLYSAATPRCSASRQLPHRRRHTALRRATRAHTAHAVPHRLARHAYRSCYY